MSYGMQIDLFLHFFHEYFRILHCTLINFYLWQENGAAYYAGGLEVGQLILQVDGTRVEGLQHQDVARLIAESFARRDREEIEFLVVEAKKSNMEPKPTALIFLEA